MTVHSSPSIPQPKTHVFARVALPTAVVAVALGVLAWSSWRAWAPLAHVKVEPVVTRSVTAGSSAGTERPASVPGPVIQAPGWIEPAPFPITVAALVPSVVEEVLVLEGDSVAAGQVVARLVDAEEALALRRAEAERDIKAADHELLLDELGRKTRLVESGAVSEGEVARLALKARGAKASLAQAQVAVDEAALALERTRVKAPSAGVVMARLAAPGALVGMSPDDIGIVSMFDPKSLQVRVDVPLADAGRLAIGASATVQVDALPGVMIRGRVIRLVQQADSAKNTLQAKVLLESPPAGLVPDMLARVKIDTMVVGRAGAGSATGSGSSRTEIVARASALGALVAGDAGTLRGDVLVVVDVRDDVGRVEKRAVTALGQPDPSGWIVVTEGLRPGDLVITDGAERVRDGSSVRVSSAGSAGAAASSATDSTGAHDDHR